MPEDPQIAVVLDELRSDAETRYFFDKATKPIWLAAAVARGYFNNPPPLRRLNGSVQLVRWPVSEYLARIAPEADPHNVLAAIEAVPDSENAAIYPNLMRALLAIPTEISVKAADQVARWTRMSFVPRFIFDEVAEFVNRLASEGHAAAALVITTSSLGFADPRLPREVEVNEAKVELRGQPQAYLDTWAFDRFLERVVPTLAQSDPVGALSVLGDLLDGALIAEYGEEGREKKRDLSYIWFRDIEGDGEQPTYEYKQAIVPHLRASALAAATKSDAGLRAVVRQLRSYPWPIHSRVALLATRLNLKLDFNLGRELVLEKEFFSLPEYRPEYSALLAAIFPRLIDEERSRVLSWIDAGPDGEVTGDLRDIWQRNRLAPISEHLVGSWAERYRGLIERYGEPEWQATHVIGPTQFWIGPTSPLTAQQIREMTVGQVIEFMRSWTPSGEMQSPSREGLARLIAADVPERAAEYVAVAQRFAELDPVYATNALSGFRSAIGSVQGINLDPVIDLAVRIVDGRVTPVARGAVGFDVDELYEWPGSHRDVAHLLEALCRANLLTAQQDTACWHCIEVLLRDPDPIAEDEARFGAGMGAVDYSINSTRGQAMHAACAFLGHLVATGRAQGGLLETVKDTLLTRLEPTVEQSAAVRAAIAMNVRTFPAVDEEWARLMAERVFSDDHLGRIGWAAALRFGGFPSSLMPAIWPILERAVGSPAWSSDPEATGPTLLLSLGMYVQGYETPVDLVDVVRRAWAAAPIEQRSHALISVGNWVTREGAPAGAAARVAELVDLILGEEIPGGAAGERRKDLEQLGWVLGNTQFPLEWTLRTLDRLLGLGVLPMDPEDVMKVMASAMEHDALQEPVVRCLERMIDLDREGWALHGGQSSLIRIIRTGKASAADSIRRHSAALESRLLAEGRANPDWFATTAE